MLNPFEAAQPASQHGIAKATAGVRLPSVRIPSVAEQAAELLHVHRNDRIWNCNHRIASVAALCIPVPTFFQRNV